MIKATTKWWIYHRFRVVLRYPKIKFPLERQILKTSLLARPTRRKRMKGTFVRKPSIRSGEFMFVTSRLRATWKVLVLIAAMRRHLNSLRRRMIKEAGLDISRRWSSIPGRFTFLLSSWSQASTKLVPRNPSRPNSLGQIPSILAFLISKICLKWSFSPIWARYQLKRTWTATWMAISRFVSTSKPKSAICRPKIRTNSCWCLATSPVAWRPAITKSTVTNP